MYYLCIHLRLYLNMVMKIFKRIIKAILLIFLLICSVPLTFFAVMVLTKFAAFMFVTGFALLPVIFASAVFYWMYLLVQKF
jgi:hypothetical protein